MAIEIKEYVGHEPQHVKETKTSTKEPVKKGKVTKKDTKQK